MKTLFIAASIALVSTPAFCVTMVSSVQSVDASWRGTGGPLPSLSKGETKVGNETAGTNLTAGSCYDPSCTIAGGFQAADGSSYAGLEVYWADAEAPFGFARTETRQTRTLLNDANVATEIKFSYLLKDIAMSIALGSGGPSRDSNPFNGYSKSVGMQVGYQVRVNGAVVDDNSFTLWGGYNAVEQNVWIDSETVGRLRPQMVVPTECDFGVCSRRDVVFSSVSETLQLGLLGAGETMKIETRMWAAAQGESSEWEAQLRIGDPNGLSPTVLTSTPAGVTPVPLPAGVSLLFSGLALLGMMRLRRMQA